MGNHNSPLFTNKLIATFFRRFSQQHNCLNTARPVESRNLLKYIKSKQKCSDLKNRGETIILVKGCKVISRVLLFQ